MKDQWVLPYANKVGKKILLPHRLQILTKNLGMVPSHVFTLVFTKFESTITKLCKDFVFVISSSFIHTALVSRIFLCVFSC